MDCWGAGEKKEKRQVFFDKKVNNKLSIKL